MAIFPDLRGTTETAIQIGKGGGQVANNSGNISFFAADGTTPSFITALSGRFTAQTSALILNSDAAGSGADWTYTINVPTSGMTAALGITLPTDAGSPGYAVVTNGSGVWSYASVGGTTDKVGLETTALAFGSSSTVSMFTLPANALMPVIYVYVDTPFNGTNPTMTIGISGNTTKYMGASQNNLKTAGVYIVHPTAIPSGSTEALVITYAADSSSAGAARVVVNYAIPA